MSPGYDAAARRMLQTALHAGAELRCPFCEIELTQQAVEPKPEVPYVRRRIWLLCPGCRRTASLDLKKPK